MPRVFISYSHDSVVHKRWVLDLAQRLRRDGIDAWLDRFVVSPPQGWPQWMRQEIESADFVLAICTPNFTERFQGGKSAKGRGVTWEGMIAQQLMYENPEERRVVPVVKDEDDAECIPLVLRSVTYFSLPSGYDGLYRLMTLQPEIVPEPLGQIRRLAAISSQEVTPLPVRSQGLPVQPREEVFAPEQPHRHPGVSKRFESRTLVSPLNCHVYHHAVVGEKYGRESAQWNILPLPNRPLDTAKGRFFPYQTFLVLVEATTCEALALVSLTDLRLEDAIPNGTRVKAGERIATVLFPKEPEKNPWSVARGVTYQEVLKFQPRIEDGVWSPFGIGRSSSGIEIVDSSSLANSGIGEIRAPLAGIFSPPPSGELAPGTRIQPMQELGIIDRQGIPHPVIARAGGNVISWTVKSGDAVHLGQTLIEVRQAPPEVLLTMRLSETAQDGWYELLSPVYGKLATREAAAGGIEAGSRIEIGEVVCELDTRNLRVKLAPDASGKVMEALVKEGEDVEIGQKLLLIRLEALVIRSPIMGNFYRSPEPGYAPFVEVGDRVKRGQVLCIIEALKLKNEIETPIDGIVEDIHAANGQPLEWQEPIFKIKFEP